MDMDSAAVFLAATILYALGFIIILIAVVIANNIIHKFWKSFGWKLLPAWSLPEHRFIAEDAPSSEPPQAKTNPGK
jgi:cytochrome b561